MKFVKTVFAQNFLYFILTAVAAVVSLYFWALAVRVLFMNHSLNRTAIARINRWEVEEVRSDRYLIKACYSFEIDGRAYHGQTLFASPAYLNPASALAAIKDRAVRSEPATIWYRQSDPAHSSLEKKVFCNLFLRAAISSAVLIYFLIKLRAAAKIPDR